MDQDIVIGGRSDVEGETGLPSWRPPVFLEGKIMGMRSSFHVAPIGLMLILVASACNAAAAESDSTPAESVTVTILSSNLANGATVGEWGFSALVEVDGRCILFDAGRYPDTVLRNAKVLDVDLSCATDVVLSHFHFDHTTGLLPILEDN